MADLATTIRRATRRDPRSLYRVALVSTVNYAALHKSMSGERPGTRIDTALKLCATLQLELRPAGRKARR